MARPPKYPLTPLLEHRDRRVEDATAELGKAVRAREGADAKKTRAQAEEQAAAERTNAVRRDEAERLARGELRAGDLAREAAWEIAAKNEAAALAEATARAEVAASEAKNQETRAQSDLAGNKAERDVVAKDRARFQDHTKKEAEKAEEEAAEEAFRGRKR